MLGQRGSHRFAGRHRFDKRGTPRQRLLPAATVHRMGGRRRRTTPRKRSAANGKERFARGLNAAPSKTCRSTKPSNVTTRNCRRWSRDTRRRWSRSRERYWDFSRCKTAARARRKSRRRGLSEFDEWFSTRTGYEALDDRIAKTFAKREELLRALTRAPNSEVLLCKGSAGSDKTVDVSLHSRSARGARARTSSRRSCKPAGSSAAAPTPTSATASTAPSPSPKPSPKPPLAVERIRGERHWRTCFSGRQNGLTSS
jgi:hypothetical protein